MLLLLPHTIISHTLALISCHQQGGLLRGVLPREVEREAGGCSCPLMPTAVPKRYFSQPHTTAHPQNKHAKYIYILGACSHRARPKTIIICVDMVCTLKMSVWYILPTLAAPWQQRPALQRLTLQCPSKGLKCAFIRHAKLTHNHALPSQANATGILKHSNAMLDPTCHRDPSLGVHLEPDHDGSQGAPNATGARYGITDKRAFDALIDILAKDVSPQACQVMLLLTRVKS
eukprot:885141-Pelagomonas_calceolata.AAC.1